MIFLWTRGVRLPAPLFSPAMIDDVCIHVWANAVPTITCVRGVSALMIRGKRCATATRNSDGVVVCRCRGKDHDVWTRGAYSGEGPYSEEGPYSGEGPIHHHRHRVARQYRYTRP